MFSLNSVADVNCFQFYSISSHFPMSRAMQPHQILAFVTPTVNVMTREGHRLLLVLQDLVSVVYVSEIN